MTTHVALEDYFRALTDADPTRATAIVMNLLDDGTPLRSITEQVLVPAPGPGRGVLAGRAVERR